MKKGFTLIELVMVVLLLSLLAAVAIPNFIDFRTDAKNAATKGALGALRSAIAVARAAIALKEDPSNTVRYPTRAELMNNQFLVASHPNLAGTAIMAPSTGVVQRPSGIPANPWSTPQEDASSNLESIVDNCDAIITGGYLPAKSAATIPQLASVCVTDYEAICVGAATTCYSVQEVLDNLLGGVEPACDPLNSAGAGWAYFPTSGKINPSTNCNGETPNTQKTELWY